MLTCAVVFGPLLVGAMALAFGFALVHFEGTPDDTLR